MKTIVIVTPVLSGLYPHMGASLRAFCEAGIPGWSVEHIVGQGCPYIGAQRNGLTRQALARGADRVFHWDSDISVPVEDVRLVVLSEHDVVCGGYPHISRPEELVAGYWTGNPGGSSSRLPTGTTGVLRVDHVGAGLLCVSRSVFERLEYPWFRHGIVTLPDGTLEEYGEDWGFCIQCARAGVDVYCDCDTRALHTKGGVVEKINLDVLMGSVNADLRGAQRVGESVLDVAKKYNAACDRIAELEKALAPAPANRAAKRAARK